MRSIRVSTDASQTREYVYEFLDVLANHALFTDHMLRNWQLEGPARGVGARAKLDSVLAGRTEPGEIEVIAAEPPVRIVERTVGAGGQRVATGTYTLDPLPDGGTRITFEYAWQQVLLRDRLVAPFVRQLTRSALEQAMQRLAERLDAAAGPPDSL